MKTLTELTGDTEVTSWIPADYYADLILEASVCYGQLSGVVTAIDYDAAQGSGGIVQVRYVPARTAQGPLGMCGCLTATSTTLGTYPITISPYGDYDEQCAFSLWKAQGPVKDKILNEMAKGLAHKRDEDIWTAIVGATPGYTYTSAASVLCTAPTYSSCCSLTVDLYNGIVNLKKQMEGGALHPDYVIMSPTVAAYLYYRDNGSVPPMAPLTPLLTFGTNGQLMTVAGLKVIESCVASACTDNAEASSPTMAVVIDSSRAVGEAWGMRPKFEEERIPYCDKYRETIWMYWGCAAMDTAAIGHLLNP